MQGVERFAATLDVDLEAPFVAAREVDPVAYLALDRDIGDESLHGLRVDAWQVPSIWVAVGIAVADVEEQNEIMAAAGIVIGSGFVTT